MQQKNNLSFEVSVLLYVILAALIFIFVDYFHKLKLKPKAKTKKVSKELKFKSVLAKEHGVKQDTLLNWIEITCPIEYSQKFAGTPVKKIPVDTLIKYLGEPDNSRNLRKSALTKACYTHRNTLTNRLKRIPDFKEKTGITLEQYFSLRVLPPKVFDRIIALHEEHFPALGKS